jgi:hypothetical protein
MGDVVSLGSSQLTSGPDVCCNGPSVVFPGGSEVIALSLLPASKPFTVSTGRQTPNVNTPSSFVALAGIGTSVTQATTLYLRTIVPMQIVVTYAGISLPTAQGVYGTVLVEADPSHAITGVTIQGVGQIEFEAWGSQ